MTRLLSCVMHIMILERTKEHKPQVVFVDEENKISRVTNYEKHGLLKDMA